MKIPLRPFNSREDVIWAAGLFEGEGWISIQGYTPSIGIQMSEKGTLERFANAVGGGPIYYRKPRIYSYEKIKTRKEQWAWRVCGFQNVQAILSCLWPWLGPRRQGRAKEVLNLSKLGKCKGGMQKGHKLSKAKHGDVRKYWQGCKCKLCKQASSVYNKKNNAKTAKYRATRRRHPKEINL